MRSRAAGALMAALSVVACLPSPPTPAEPARSAFTPAVPGDRFFRAVFSGRSYEADVDVSGSLVALAFSPANAPRRAPLGLGADPSREQMLVVARFADGTSVRVGGDVRHGDDTLTVADGPWTFTASFAGDGIEGTLVKASTLDSSRELVSLWFAGADDPRGAGVVFCGSYEGLASGAWNLFVRGNGLVEGEFSGDAHGWVSGTENGDRLGLTWFGGSALGPFAGTASGTLDAAALRVRGTWWISGRSDEGTFVSLADGCAAAFRPSVVEKGECPCAAGNVMSEDTCCYGAADSPWCCLADSR